MYLSLILPLLLPSALRPAEDPLLIAVRTASGITANLTQDLLLTGSGTRLNLDGTYTLRIGSGGKYVSSFKSALGDTTGFDGTHTWEADRAGATRICALGNEDVEKTTAALLTGYWLVPGVVADIKAVNGNTLSLRLKGSEIEPHVLLDKATNLPVKVTYSGEAGLVEIDFSDYRKVGSQTRPFKIKMVEGGVSDELQIDSAVSVPTDHAAFAMPKWTASDVTFDDSIPKELPTKRLPSGHIMVHPLVDGKDVGWFILDSGAEAMCIDKGTADAMNLKSVGMVPAVGVGGVVKVPFREADSMTLGQGTFKDLMFVELDLAEISKMLGVKLGGIIGYDVFRRAIIEMQVGSTKVSLADPANYKLKSGTWQPILFDGGNIGVQANFEGNRTGWFRLDTGAAGTVSFHTPFVEKYKLLDKRPVVRTQEGGVGGIVEASQGKLAYFEIAKHRFEKPTVVFSTAKIGAMSSKWLVGNIGQDFMNPFVMIFDYPNSRMAFVEAAK
ncbi:hypothetical protein BH11ARM1_BH11ARM1_07990 [soil metagenome]